MSVISRISRTESMVSLMDRQEVYRILFEGLDDDNNHVDHADMPMYDICEAEEMDLESVSAETTDVESGSDSDDTEVPYARSVYSESEMSDVISDSSSGEYVSVTASSMSIATPGASDADDEYEDDEDDEDYAMDVETASDAEDVKTSTSTEDAEDLGEAVGEIVYAEVFWPVDAEVFLPVDAAPMHDETASLSDDSVTVSEAIARLAGIVSATNGEDDVIDLWINADESDDIASTAPSVNPAPVRSPTPEGDLHANILRWLSATELPEPTNRHAPLLRSGSESSVSVCTDFPNAALSRGNSWILHPFHPPEEQDQEGGL